MDTNKKDQPSTFKAFFGCLGILIFALGGIAILVMTVSGAVLTIFQDDSGGSTSIGIALAVIAGIAALVWFISSLK